MTDLVERLRHMAKLVGFDLAPLLNEAADRLSAAQPQYLSGCLRGGACHGTCHGTCQSTACTNYGKAIVARRCVEDVPAGAVMPKEMM